VNDAQGCPSLITVGSETVACVGQFIYLGSIIDSNGNCEPEIRRRNTIAKSVMQQTYRLSQYGMLTLLSRPNYVSTFYNTCIPPIVLYASECCAPTKADVALLDAFDEWCLRRLLGITWQDHITNIEVRERTGLPAVSETISQRRLSMLGHVSRMPPSADAYKAIYQDIPSYWRRRPGRPRQSWLATIHRDLRRGNWILTWTMFLNLLPIVNCGGGWFVALCTTLLHARPTGDDDVVTRLRFGGIFNDNNRFYCISW